jgi:hypothetical protein
VRQWARTKARLWKRNLGSSREILALTKLNSNCYNLGENQPVIIQFFERIAFVIDGMEDYLVALDPLEGGLAKSGELF